MSTDKDETLAKHAKKRQEETTEGTKNTKKFLGLITSYMDEGAGGAF